MPLRLLRHVKGLCFPGALSSDEDPFSSNRSSAVLACEWAPEHIPITRLSVTAQEGSRRTSRRSWVSDFAHEPRQDEHSRQHRTTPVRNMSR